MVGPWPLAPHHDYLQYIHHIHLMQWGQNRGVTCIQAVLLQGILLEFDLGSTLSTVLFCENHAPSQISCCKHSWLGFILIKYAYLHDDKT